MLPVGEIYSELAWPGRYRRASLTLNLRRCPIASNLPVLDYKATFVDVGSERMHVSIAGAPPRVFGTVTSQLNSLRDWLLEERVHSVAMEATGVYRLPLYNILEQAGLEVRMINGRQTRNLPGRKTDMADAQWGAIPSTSLHSNTQFNPGKSKDMALGGFYRRLRGCRGAQVAIKAVARKLATWVWW